MNIITKTLKYSDGDTLLEGFVAYDEHWNSPRPGVLISPTWAGRNAFAEEKAIKIAELGYVGFALDVYGNGKVGANPAENAALMQTLLDDRVLLQRRMLAALSTIRQLACVNAEKIAAIGFCFGGLTVLDLARTGAELDGVVSFHGLLHPADNTLGKPIHAKVLVLHGANDPLVSPEELSAIQQELTAAGADWQLHIYGHTQHAFTNPIANSPELGMVYQPVSAQRAWEIMRGFLIEIFAEIKS